ncbi:amino acid adenylation domain-containing protein [Actinokineospora guangxiensis]|uniref:Amino acid adenylation domain-containing protein n=1 Tax=Actinokineospora guangxiensis TaxID=1490288 RepID=A0ABW0EM17_9PSEU
MSAQQATIVDVLRGRAARTPDRDAYAFLPDGRTESARLSFAEVDRRARAIAVALLDRARPGDRVLITYPAHQGREFVTGFLGCLYAGMVAVPCDAEGGRSGAERLAWIGQDAAPALVLGSADAGTEKAGAPVVDVATVPDDAADYQHHPVRADDIALLQYTSGSTRRPRGVMVSHGNIMANEHAIATTCEHDGDSTFVGWLPLFHDMGLIANVLQPLYLGSLSVLMPPTAFLADPLCWPEAISRYRGVTSGGPNFAYDLCAARARPDLDLDLSTWRVAFNGAEVVRAATLRRFVSAFGPHGFTPEAFFPCYGLAEATLIVTGAPRGVRPRQLRADPDALRGGRLAQAADGAPAHSLVSSGRLAGDAQVTITDPDSGAEVADGVFGEVRVRGGSVAQGYWRRREESAAVFPATDSGPLLRTGDLGALVDGELYLVGRLKDMIVIRGQNLYPDDIEWAAERAHRALRPSCGAAFALEDGEHERLAVVYEIAPGADGVDIAEVAAAVRAAIADRHGVEPHLVALVRRGSVPKTTSGKVRRGGCRAAWTAGALPIVAVSSLDDAGRSAVDRAEAAIGRALADAEDAGEPLALDSLAATQLGHRVERVFGVRVPLALLLGPVSTRMVADAIAAGRLNAGSEHIPEEGDPRVGPPLPAQEALWFEEQLADGYPAYHLVRALEMRGHLDRGAFARALGGLIDAHPALRTSLGERDGAVAQRVGERGPKLAEGVLPAERLAERLHRECADRLALDGTVPVRFTLLKHGEHHHTLVLAAHHAVADLWSLSVIIGDLFARYSREAGSDSPQPRPPVVTPIAHARRSAALMRGEAGDVLRQYWRHRLAGAPSVLPLPTDRPRPRTRSFRGASAPFTVSAEVTGRMRALAAERAATPFAVAMACLQLLLSRLTGQRDVVVGTIVHGRDRADLADVVGCFVNLVPIRGHIRPGATFAALVEQTGHDLRADLVHSGLPFPEIVRQHGPQRESGTPSLVQVLAVFHADTGGIGAGTSALALGRSGPLRIPGALDVRAVATPQPWTHVDLTLNLAEADGALAGSLEYNPDLFDADTIAELAERFTTLLGDAVTRPHLPVHRHRLLTGDEFHTAVRAAQGPAVPREPDLTLHDLVLRQARRTPDAIAVCARDADGTSQQLSYRTLVRWASSVAATLLDHGLRAEEPVAVLLDRGATVPAAALGVLMAGGAYLPVDPSGPPRRLRGVLQDAGVRMVLTTTGPGSPPLPSGVTPLDVGECRTHDGPSSRAAHPDQLAYVIYTSGTTGNPKGVAVAHRAIVNRLLWMQEQFALDPHDRVAHKTPTTFDVSLWELFWPLVTGTCLVVVPPGAHRDPGALARALAEQQVTTTHFVPTMLRGFLTDPAHAGLRGLARVICSGEELPAVLAHRAAHRLDAQVHNLYGPTEAAVDVTWWHCAPGEQVPIGHPITNVEAHVLGSGGALPSRFPGEIHLGGVCLARGYLGAPAATAAAFIPRPWADRPGARLYATGDLGRRRTDGAVEYLGRADRQVKIAGVRVESVETESALRGLAAVVDAACLADQGRDGPRLVAYIVPRDTAHPVDLASLRTALRDRLPAAFLPSAVVSVPELPTTRSGKLDRAALPPAPEAPEPAPAPPGTPLEARIAEIWAAVLGTRRAIGAHEDFFAAGGDSLIAVSLVARLRDAGVAVTVADLMEARTVSATAALARSRDGEPAPTPLPPFALCPPGHRAALPDQIEDAYPISMAQRAVLSRQLACRATAAGAGHEVYVTSVRVKGPFDPAALRSAADHVLARHPYLRSSFDLAAEPEPLQLVHAAMPAPLTTIDLRHHPAERHDEIITAWVHGERLRPLNPDTGPLVRFTAHHRGDDDFQLSVGSFALDGWCTATILTELLIGHAAARRGEDPTRPPLTGGYPDFVALETAARRSPEHRRFWRRKLTAVPACLVPTGEHPVEGDRLTRRRTLDIAPDLADRLRRIAADHGVPLKTVLLAAHLRVVREYTTSDDVVTMLETNGRPEHHDGHRTVGVFNNLVPLRVAMPNGTWGELLAAAWEAEREMLPHRRYPFAAIDREHHVRALTNALFVYTHFHIYGELADDPDVHLVGGVAPDQTYMPLTAHFNQDAQTRALRLLLDHDPVRFTDAAAQHLIDQYAHALAALGDAPEQPWKARPLLAPDSRRAHVLSGRAARQSDATVHALILRQAYSSPDTVAAVAVDQDGTERHLTYRGLASASERVAAALREAGVRTDTLVALPARPSLEFVVGLLAILRAGGAYLPVEPDDPAERTHRALTVAGVRHAVRWGDARLDLPPGCSSVRVDETATSPKPPVASAGHPAALAYAVHTSGSTGSPKLIGVSHAAVANYLRWCHTEYQPHTGRTVAHSRLSFDLTVTSLLGPLTSGGTVVLPRRDTTAALPALLPQAHGPLKITPAHLEALGLQLATGVDAPATVVAGGDALLARHLRPWTAIAPDIPVVNEYGPTETTVGCCFHRTTAARAPERVPIGLPIDGVHTAVMSARGPVPPGALGELHVGGLGVARGYLGSPALTAARFTPDPDALAGRVYRTGDIVHLGDDGLLHYAGRADRQLKVRGFRVEPAEVEAALREHPRVHDAAVVGIPARQGHVRLVAYWVGPPGKVDLGSALAGVLPAHMVPTEIVRLAALPLTPNGKVDHAALTDPDFARKHRALAAVEDLGPAGAGELLGLGGAAHG